VNCLVCEALRVAVKGLILTPIVTMAVSWTVALADFVGSATLVAVTVTACAALIREGAVYNPFNKLPNEGVMDQFTDVFELPVTVAVNCLLCDAVRVADNGLILMLTMGVSWTVALADLVESATLVAVIITDCALLMTDGAVYNPFDKLPTEGFMDQVTEVVELPVTVAANCLVWDAVRVALEGLKLTLTPGGSAGRVIVPAPPLAGMELPAAVVATTPEIWTGIDVADGADEIWKVAVATVPSAMAVLLKPRRRQLFPEHVMLLPALVADGPATTLTLVISEE
jgi:hypothetical protein